MQFAFRSYFDAVSAAFDALLFRAGRKQTLKLNATKSNDGPLARHNMIHCNNIYVSISYSSDDYVIQQFHLRYGPTAHAEYEAAFFHPLLKTPQVRGVRNEFLLWFR